MGKLSGRTRPLAVVLASVATLVASRGQSLTTLYNFIGGNANHPVALVQGPDGNFYGVTQVGGANISGTIFKITPSGALTTLHSFCAQMNCIDGSNPLANLIQGADGDFYGTTNQGGVDQGGTVFKTTANGSFTSLHSFCRKCGDVPRYPYTQSLVQALDGNLYGAAGYAVFRMNPSGALTTVHDFSPGSPSGGLLQARDGKFYGTTANDGSERQGTAFQLTPSGILTSLYNFCSQPNCADGSEPTGLTQGTDGNFYGVTLAGGVSQLCTADCETVFRISPDGALTTLHTFDISDTGNAPGGLVQATDGNFYGTSPQGGPGGGGIAFQITPSGTVTVLHSFCTEAQCADGGLPSSLVQGTDGGFYGVTAYGGANGNGTVFRLSTGLGPFVNIVPSLGYAGATVSIQGTSLAGATSVTFNAAPAVFTVVSPTQIIATVPSDTTSGPVQVLTPIGTLVSNVAFTFPTPAVFTFTPTSGPVGASVVITGRYLTGATSVTFAGVKATTFAVNSSTQITALVPDGAETGNVSVATPGGRTRGGGIFTVLPSISNFSPSSGPAGTPVTIHGHTFAGATGVAFGGVPAVAFTVNSPKNLTATVPNGALTGTVGVTTPSGTGFSASNFKVPPSISAFSPAVGTVGTDVVIAGQGLKQTTGVTFGKVPATVFEANSDTRITATVPGGAHTGEIGVTTLGGSELTQKAFTVKPSVSSFSSPSGPVGTVVSIFGQTFTGAFNVSFGGIPARSFSVNSDTQITAIVPTGVLQGRIEVTTSSGTGLSTAYFVALPVISSFSPGSGPVGAVVALTGETFTGATSVTFGGVKATKFVVDSYTRMTATVPLGAKSGRISVTNPDGTASSTRPFEVK